MQLITLLDLLKEAIAATHPDITITSSQTDVNTGRLVLKKGTLKDYEKLKKVIIEVFENTEWIIDNITPSDSDPNDKKLFIDVYKDKETKKEKLIPPLVLPSQTSIKFWISFFLILTMAIGFYFIKMKFGDGLKGNSLNETKV